MEKDNSPIRLEELTDEELLTWEKDTNKLNKMLIKECKKISRNCGKCHFPNVCSGLSTALLEIFFEKLRRNIK